MRRVFVTGGSGFVGRELLGQLADKGIVVHALARSDRARAVVDALGARAITGDLDDRDAMVEGMRGCDAVIHIAGAVDFWGSRDYFEQVNVAGTTHAVEAARAAGVPRFVHVSAAAVLLDGSPLRDADASTPIAPAVSGLYSETKARAERAVLAATGIDRIVVRPGLVWGEDDPSFLPGVIQAIERGQFAWIDGGRYRFSTVHVTNLAAGLIAAASHGRDGGIYYFKDEGDVEFRSFVTELLSAVNVTAPKRSVPRWLARLLARTITFAYRVLGIKSAPPLTPELVRMLGQETTFNDTPTRQELGFTPPTDRATGFGTVQAQC